MDLSEEIRSASECPWEQTLGSDLLGGDLSHQSTSSMESFNMRQGPKILTVLVNRAMFFGCQHPGLFFKPLLFCYSNKTWSSRKQGKFGEKLCTMNSIPSGPTKANQGERREK